MTKVGDVAARIQAGRRAAWIPRASEQLEPVLRNVTMDVDADTAQNLELHARVHVRFLQRTQLTADDLVDWIYRELFAMPPDDPSLGLDVPDPFTTAGSWS